MSSSVSATFGLELHACRWQWALAVAVVCACALVPWCLHDVPFWVQLAASLLGAGVSGTGIACVGWWPMHTAIVRIAHASNDDWCLEDGTGRALHTRLHPQTRFFRQFIWLRFASRHSFLLGPGDLAPDQFRRLQVFLRRHSLAPARERVA